MRDHWGQLDCFRLQTDKTSQFLYATGLPQPFNAVAPLPHEQRRGVELVRWQVAPVLGEEWVPQGLAM